MKILRQILGETYGGPSISYDDEMEEFVLYAWGDAPVSMDVYVRDKNWTKFIQKCEKWHKEDRAP